MRVRTLPSPSRHHANTQSVARTNGKETPTGTRIVSHMFRRLTLPVWGSRTTSSQTYTDFATGLIGCAIHPPETRPDSSCSITLAVRRLQNRPDAAKRLWRSTPLMLLSKCRLRVGKPARKQQSQALERHLTCWYDPDYSSSSNTATGISPWTRHTSLTKSGDQPRRTAVFRWACAVSSLRQASDRPIGLAFIGLGGVKRFKKRDLLQISLTTRMNAPSFWRNSRILRWSYANCRRKNRAMTSCSSPRRFRRVLLHRTRYLQE